MKQITTNVQPELIEPTHKFKGYTIEELRYQRAMLALRKEFCKVKLMESIQGLKPGGRKSESTVSKKGSSKLALAGKIAGKLLSNLNALDYVLMGLSLFGTVKKGYKLIRGKK